MQFSLHIMQFSFIYISLKQLAIMCFVSSVRAIIAGAVIFALVCTFLTILIPVCIVCRIKFGICRSNRNRQLATRVVTTAATPTAADVSTTSTTMRGLTGIRMSVIWNHVIVIFVVYYACICTSVQGEICDAASCWRGSTTSIDTQQTYTTVGLYRTWWGHC